MAYLITLHHIFVPGADMSPETLTAAITGAYNGQLADVWSCGVMLYVMLFGRYPFDLPAPVSGMGRMRLHGTVWP